MLTNPTREGAPSIGPVPNTSSLISLLSIDIFHLFDK